MEDFSNLIFTVCFGYEVFLLSRTSVYSLSNMSSKDTGRDETEGSYCSYKEAESVLIIVDWKALVVPVHTFSYFTAT